MRTARSSRNAICRSKRLDGRAAAQRPLVEGDPTDVYPTRSCSSRKRTGGSLASHARANRSTRRRPRGSVPWGRLQPHHPQGDARRRRASTCWVNPEGPGRNGPTARRRPLQQRPLADPQRRPTHLTAPAGVLRVVDRARLLAAQTPTTAAEHAADIVLPSPSALGQLGLASRRCSKKKREHAVVRLRHLRRRRIAWTGRHPPRGAGAGWMEVNRRRQPPTRQSPCSGSVRRTS